MENHPPLRILSLDGGGIRGISSLYILKELMAQIKRQRQIDNPPEPMSTLRPCEVFDLICGTSTGGLIALMLGRLEMTIEEAISKYLELSETIFTTTSKVAIAKFEHRALEHILKRVIRESPLNLEAEAPLADPNTCKTFVVATRTRAGGAAAIRMRTYDTATADAFPARIWEAARATSAAPTFFQPIIIDGVTYGDGGTGWNNPTAEAISEAYKIWPGRPIGCLVSIGTGLENAIQLPHGSDELSDGFSRLLLQRLAPKAAFQLEVAKYCAASLTSCEKVHRDVSDKYPDHVVPNRNYFRFNVPQGMSAIGLEEWKKVGDIIALTQDYMEHGEIEERKKAIAKVLLNPQFADFPSKTGFLTTSSTYFMEGSELFWLKKRQEVLNWVWTGDHWHRHSGFQSRRTPNTGMWIFECPELKGWQKGDESRTLICYGIHKFLEQTGNLSLSKTAVLHFYFDYNNQAQETVEYVVRSLLAQLLFQLESVPLKVGKAYKRWLDKHMRVRMDVFLDLLMTCSKQFHKVFIFLDAYDESLLDERNSLLWIFRRFSEHGSNLHTCITTRSHLADNLTGVLGAAKLLEISAREDDVYAYLIAELETAHLDDDTKRKIVYAICDAARGKFLLAYYQLKYVRDQYEPRAMEEALESMPITLTEAYNQIISRMDRRGPGVKALALRTLLWICKAARPLQMEEVREFLAIRKGDKDLSRRYCPKPDDILEACESLIMQEKPGGTVVFTHYTVQEFLRNDCEDLPAITYLPIVCLTYLTFDEFEEWDLEDSTKRSDFSGRSKDSEKRRLDEWKAKYHSLEYVARFWDLHARDAEDSPEVRELVFDFLQSEKKRMVMLGVRCLDSMEFGYSAPKGMTVLHFIAESGLTQICRLALENASNPDHPYFPLATSSLFQSMEASSCLSSLVTLADLERIDEHGRIPLHVAATNGHIELVGLLLERGSMIEAKMDCEVEMDDGDCFTFGITPLQAAAKAGHQDVVNLLLEYGAAIEPEDEGFHALHWAALGGHKEAVKILLDWGARPDAVGHEHTALYLAAGEGHTEVVKTLLDWGAAVDFKDDDSDTPLIVAASGGHEAVVKLLLDRGADTEIEGSEHAWTALGCAVFGAYQRVVEVLLENGADPEAVDDNGLTPLGVAAEFGDEFTVQVLLTRGANTEARDPLGRTPLGIAAMYYEEGVVKMLLKGGADIEARDNEGRTPLALALWVHGDTECGVTQALLEYGADVKVMDRNGHTPLWLATHPVDEHKHLRERLDYIRKRSE